MKVFRTLDNLPSFKNAVITIGSYDGVHVGHQSIFNRIHQLAKEVNGGEYCHYFPSASTSNCLP